MDGKNNEAVEKISELSKCYRFVFIILAIFCGWGGLHYLYAEYKKVFCIQLIILIATGIFCGCNGNWKLFCGVAVLNWVISFITGCLLKYDSHGKKFRSMACLFAQG